VPHGRYTVERVVRDLRTLLGDPAYARRATAVAAEMTSEGGAEAAAEALDAVLAGHG
jgi:UDP:flavonoid glycosyltransferase YjiC (YdhE family)